MRSRFLPIIPIFAILAFSNPALHGYELITGGLPIKIEGEKVDYLMRDGLVVAIDKASVEYEDIKIFADRLEINISTSEVKALNNVYYKKDNNTMHAGELLYNFKEHNGYITGNIKGSFPPWYWNGERIEIISKNKFALSEGSFTTCDREPPHYHLSCSSATLDMDDKATAKNVFFFLDGVPVFYFPYYYTYMKHPPYGLVNWVGHSEEKGFMDLAHYNWYVNDKLRGRIYLDYLEELGWGYGFDVDLKTDGGKNYIYGYYMDEDSDFYGQDSIKRYGGTGEGSDKYKRWKGVFKHRQRWQNDWASMMKIEKFSDENFNKDFFFEEMNKGTDSYSLSRDPENYFALEQIKPDYNFVFYASNALNDFEYLIERQPSISFATREQKIENSPLHYKLEANYTHFNEEFPQDEDPEGDSELDRFDLFGKLSSPHRINEWLTSEPYLTFRGTGYTEDADGKGAFRTTESVGWNLRSKLAKQYGNVQHIFQPQIGYYYRPEPSISRDELIRLDPIDRINSQNGFFVEIINRIKVPQSGQTEEYFAPEGLDEIYLREYRESRTSALDGQESLISPSAGPNETVTYTEPFNLRVFSNYSVKDQEWDYVFMENTFTPFPGISLISDATYSPRKNQFEIVNSSLGISKWQKAGGSLGLSYYRDYIDEGEDLYRANGTIWFNFAPNMELALSTSYDMENEFVRSNGIYIKKYLHCWTAELSMNNYKRTHDEDYTFEVFLTFSLTDLPGFKLPLSGEIKPEADEE